MDMNSDLQEILDELFGSVDDNTLVTDIDDTLDEYEISDELLLTAFDYYEDDKNNEIPINVQPSDVDISFDDDGISDELLLTAVKQYEDDKRAELPVSETFDDDGISDELLLNAVLRYEESVSQAGNGVCPVCRGMATTSSAVCTCRGHQREERTCSNCKRNFRPDGSGNICPTCLLQPYCRSCRRYMPDVDFDSTDDKGRCRACINKTSRHTVRASREDVLTEVDITTDPVNDTSFESLFYRTSNQIDNIVEQFQAKYRSIKVQMQATVDYSRRLLDIDGEEIEQQTNGYFHTQPQHVVEGESMDLSDICSDLSRQAENFTTKGSGFRIDFISRLAVVVTKFSPFCGSSYLPTPKWLEDKQCVVNVRNTDDKCFVWSVLAAIHPARKNHWRLSHYEPFENSLNLQQLTFPLPINQISTFEQNNADISVNVLSVAKQPDNFHILYLSQNPNRLHQVNLLLLESKDRKHYVLINNMSRLIAGRTKHDGKSFVCNSCLHVFTNASALENHRPYCRIHAPQQVYYPNPDNEDEVTVKFRDIKKMHKLPFYLVCDFESFLVKSDDDQQRVIETHVPSGFACYRVTDLDQYRTEPVVFSGDNVMERFFQHIFNESQEINAIMKTNLPMKNLTPEQTRSYISAEICSFCKQEFTDRNHKCRHHDHLTGEYIGPVCNSCNLLLKITGRRRRARPSKKVGPPAKRALLSDCVSDDDDDDDDDGQGIDSCDETEFILPVLAHNMKCYDAHLVIKHFRRKYAMRTLSNGKVVYDDVEVIAKTSEKFTMFQFRGIRFIDSYLFLSSSLENLVSILVKSGKEKFEHTIRYLGDNDLIFAKGVYPYSYMDSAARFVETSLPSKECFYDILREEHLSDDDYARARQTWSMFNVKDMKGYHDHYLLTDVLLLTDVFENFRQSIYANHQLDCLHFCTLPGLAWSMALKYTGAELQLLTDPDKYLMTENAMRGGISTVSCRRGVANNPLMEKDYDPSSPRKYLAYFDANNLYGWSMSQCLPTGNFRFLAESEIADFVSRLSDIADDADAGYFVECDLHYPPEIHDLHNAYPMAPEHLLIKQDMLSPYARSFDGLKWAPSTKLVPNLLDKTKYVTHYRNLKLYLKHGLVLTKVHRVLTFSQSAWLKPWIDYCTAGRQNATSEFESDNYKLLANAIFGKSCQNVRGYNNIRLIADPAKLKKAVSKNSYKYGEIINDDLTMVQLEKQKVKLNQPLYTGFSILELSKVLMFGHYYDYLMPKYGPDKCRLMYTDTDSYILEIETDDLHADMRASSGEYDTSNFPPDHPLFSKKNCRVVGKFKSETGHKSPMEFIGLRSKSYSLLVTSSEPPKKTVKGVNKSFVKHKVHHEHYVETLVSKRRTEAKFNNIVSKNHVLQTVQVRKVCLSAFDDKRYILADGVHTLAYGHRDIMSGKAERM